VPKNKVVNSKVHQEGAEIITNIQMQRTEEFKRVIRISTTLRKMCFRGLLLTDNSKTTIVSIVVMYYNVSSLIRGE
jgi:hypothetical protein